MCCSILFLGCLVLSPLLPRYLALVIIVVVFIELVPQPSILRLCHRVLDCNRLLCYHGMRKGFITIVTPITLRSFS